MAKSDGDGDAESMATAMSESDAVLATRDDDLRQPAYDEMMHAAEFYSEYYTKSLMPLMRLFTMFDMLMRDDDAP